MTEYQTKYFLEHKKEINEKSRKYNKTAKGILSSTKSRKKERDNLTDNYLRQNIYINLYSKGVKIRRKDITKEQLEIQRNLIKMRRILKSIKNENT